MTKPKPLTTEGTEEHGGNVLALPVFAVDHAPDSVFQVKDVEIDRQADTDSAETHVREKLGFMDWMDRVHGFHLDHDSGFYHYVDTVSDFESLAVIDNWQRDLRSYRQTSVSEFVRKARLISAFKEAWADYGMDSHASCDHGVCDLVYSKRRPLGGGSHEYCISQSSVFLCDLCGGKGSLVSIWDKNIHHRGNGGTQRKLLNA